MTQPLSAVDLYSGIGGWSLGFRMAGIGVLASYERWEAANETNRRNNGHTAVACDIRKLAPSELPPVSIVVGSPPCTQFSFSNRGGSGDISDGLEDVFAFLRIVQHLRPRWWVMENVPRLATVMNGELNAGRLEEFNNLPFDCRVFDLADFGLPQRRRRCLMGNIDFDLLSKYTVRCPSRTLGDILRALSDDPITDPIYGLSLAPSEVSEQVPEQVLNVEEERINRAAKTLHPVYNTMSFPDQVGRPVRTVTATCTRVSRESIVIEAPELPGAYRRLTLRERALAQGFPVAFQFFGKSHAQKIKMVGNAVPPLFAFYVGHAIRGTDPESLPRPDHAAEGLVWCKTSPRRTAPDSPAFRYRSDRRFRFAIPSLRMKSGMRFELTNGANQGSIDWHVLFVFGTSKAVNHLRPDKRLLNAMVQDMPEDLRRPVLVQLASLEVYLTTVDVGQLQAVWSHTGPGTTRPFMLLDELSDAGERLTLLTEQYRAVAGEVVASALEVGNQDRGIGRKEAAHAPRILSGLLLAAVTNYQFGLGPKTLPRSLHFNSDQRFTA